MRSDIIYYPAKTVVTVKSFGIKKSVFPMLDYLKLLVTPASSSIVESSFLFLKNIQKGRTQLTEEHLDACTWITHARNRKKSQPHARNRSGCGWGFADMNGDRKDIIEKRGAKAYRTRRSVSKNTVYNVSLSGSQKMQKMFKIPEKIFF